MKFLHLADIHLGSKLNDLEQAKRESRNKDIFKAFDNAIQYAKNNGIDLILISGDLFDKDQPSVKVRNDFLNKVKNNEEIFFLYITGNHDKKDIFSSLNTKITANLKLFEEKYTTFTHKNVNFVGLNYSSSMYKYLYDSLKLNESEINVLMLHGEVMQGEAKDKINLKKLVGRNVDYLALGHIHQNEIGNIDERGIYVYPGCLEGRGFDELNKKGFYEVDTDDIKNPKFIINSIRTIYEVSLDISNIDNDDKLIKEIEKKLKELNILEKDYVRIILKGTYNPDNEFFKKDLDEITSYFKEKYYVFKIKDQTTLIYNLDKYKGTLSLKGYFIDSILNDDSLSQEQKDELIKVGLRLIIEKDNN